MSEGPLPVRQRIARGELPRHRHVGGYVAVVLSGGYEEAGDLGRHWVAAGDIIAHRPFEAHLNRVSAKGAEVLNLPLPAGMASTFGRAPDLDAVVRAARRGPHEALQALLAQLAPATAAPAGDWPEALAQRLASPGPADLRAWAQARDLSPEHVSRGFRRVFGVSPKRYRAEARARAALAEIRGTGAPLAAIAQACGFADQSHMSRAVLALTGRPPGSWRRSTAFKT